ncbi:MAG TPA: phosphoribosyltransferase family protein [Candidatus Paceibacterota bacterium]
MTEDKILAVLQKVGAFRSGHFVLISGRHSDAYINKDTLYPYTHDTSDLCLAMAERFKEKNIEAVIGPAVGAAILSMWTAYHLTELNEKQVYGTYADKDGQGGFVIKRGFDQLIKGKRTLVVEDLTTTGGSIKKVVEAARAVGAEVVGAVVLGNRGDVSKEAAGNPPEFISMVNVQLESWDADECELCKKGIPINTEVGHGKQFLEKRKTS